VKTAFRGQDIIDVVLANPGAKSPFLREVRTHEKLQQKADLRSSKQQ